MVRIPDTNYIHLKPDMTVQPPVNRPQPYQAVLCRGETTTDLLAETTSFSDAYTAAQHAHKESGLPLWITQPNGGLIKAMTRDDETVEKFGL